MPRVETANALRFGIAFLSLACPSAASACSLNEDEYRPPTNIELIERADLVVLGRVSASELAKAPDVNALVLTPIRTLKGHAPAKLTFHGVVRDRQGKSILPEPTRLDQVHSSSAWGACDRQAYAPGTLVIAMFLKRDEGYVHMSYPFARTTEDVAGPDALWVRAAALYAKIISENPATERRQAFQRERQRMLAQSDDPDAQVVAQDIATYLQATAKSK